MDKIELRENDGINGGDSEDTTTPDIPVEPSEPIEPPVDPENPEEPEVPEEPPAQENKWYYQSIPDFYDRVRASLNVGGTISDSVIDYFENAPMAEIKMKKRVPNWEGLDEMDTLLFQTCIIYMACYMLCPLASSMRISRQKDPSLEIEFASSSQQENPCDRFLGLIDELVAQITGEEVPFGFGFKVTSGSGCKQVKPCWPYRHSKNAYDPL